MRLPKPLLEFLLAAGLVVLLSLGCCKKVVTPPPVIVVKAPCELQPPPIEPAVKFSGTEQGCPPQWEACLDKGAALQLLILVRAQRAWISETWARCGPSP